MITKEVFLQIVSEAREALSHYHLSDALFLIPSLLKELNNEDFTREFESIDRDYNAMLGFLTNGGIDPSQEEMQGKMVRKTFLLLNKIDAHARIKRNNDYFASCYNRVTDTNFCYDSTGTRAFETAYCANILPYSYEELEMRLQYFSERDLQQFIAGLMLNIWEYFTPKTLQLLAHLVVNETNSEPRALVGIVMVALKYEKQLPLFPESDKMVRKILTTPIVQEWVCRTNRELFMSSQTESIEKKIRQELMPILTEGIKDERLRMGFQEDMENLEGGIDAFEKLLKNQVQGDDKKMDRKKKKFSDSIMQIFNMQKEGVDTNMDLFISNMSNVFFQNMANWFRPFDPHDKTIEDVTYKNGKPNVLMKLMISQSTMYDIDKYSLALMLRSAMTGFFGDMLRSATHEAEGAESLVGTDYSMEKYTPEQEISNTVRILYRLFTKSRWKHEMANLFEYPLNFLENDYLRLAMQDNIKVLNEIAQLMHKYGDSHIAHCYLKRIAEIEGSTFDTLSTMGACLINLGKHRQAIGCLQQADILKVDDPVVLKMLIDCYEKTQNYEALLDCLLRLEEIVPNSSKITTDTGLCLMKLERYKEASQRFYKLELEEKKVVPSMRAIAWCAFKQQKYETALRYYKKLYNLHTAATWEDYLNGGHTAWLLGDMTSALTFYHQYVKHYLTDDPKITNVMAPFDKDNAELLMHGKTQREIDIMHELIQHNN